MNRKYLDNIYNAKESIKIWISNAEQYHFGNQMFAKANELDRRGTAFANWYYGEGQVFTSFETFKALEAFYDEMYDTYLTYVTLREKPIKKSLFVNERDKRIKILNEIFQDLKQKGRKLIKSLDIFEENIKTSPLYSQVESNFSFFDTQGPIEDLTFDTGVFNSPDSSIPSFEEEKKESDLDKLLADFARKSLVENLEDNLGIKDENSEELKDFEPKESIEEFQYSITNNAESEKAVENIADLSIEQRIQEELEKMRKVLEEEIREKLKKESQNKPQINENSQYTAQEKKENIESNQHVENNSQIDLDEEIRRILS